MESVWRFAALAGALTCGCGAVDWKALQPAGYVSDFAGVIDAPTKVQLEDYCAAVERATGAQIALVTIPTLEGEPVEEAANTMFRAWGVGRKGRNEGVLLLLAIEDHRSRLEVGYGLEPILTDGSMGGLLRQMRPALSAGRYGEAMLAAVEAIGGTIASAKHVALSASPPLRERPAPAEWFPWPSLLGAMVLLPLLLRRGRRAGYGGWGGGFLPGLILGGAMGRATWGGRGSGGFGGFDSGDGFGGFGGGDSGGGGASSDW